MKNKNIGLFIQFILTLCSAIMLFISIFEKSFLNIVYILLSFTLFTMAYNNVKVYKRKYLTIVYIIFGILILLSMLLEVLF